MRKSILFSLLILFNLSSFTQDLRRDKVSKEIEKSISECIELYKHLHKNPELSFKEFETSKRISDKLNEIGFSVTDNFGGNSIVGVYKNGEGPVIMMRTDMDALPIEEKTELEYASKIKMTGIEGIEFPVMHACGHDMHMTVFITTATTLVKLKKYWNGTLVFIAQQAEEYSSGSREMIKAGLFQKFPKPDKILAYHVSAELPAGTIGYTEGSTFAGVSSVNVTFYGVGGHGALPHTTIDPIVIASKAIIDYQTITSREISALEPAIVTIGSIHGGTKNNIIPDEVELKLTLRAFDENVMAHLVEAVKRKSKSAAKSANVPDNLMPKVEVLKNATPPVINNNTLLRSCVNSFKNVIGNENVIEVIPATVSEDFARYGLTDEKIPICLTWLGSVNKEKFEEYKENNKSLPQLHSPYYTPDPEPTLRTGANAMVNAIIDLMQNKDEMIKLIKNPSVIKAAGTKEKIIEEYIGRVNSKTSDLSIARMISPEGWEEPGQKPEFDEYTLVLKGTLKVKTEKEEFDVTVGQAIIIGKNEWVQYSSPYEGGAEYIAVCLPAFSPETVHREK
jgi:hippurate hydrolase